jgi:hypothetical protein
MYILNLLPAVHWQWGPGRIREGRGGTCLEGGKGQQLPAAEQRMREEEAGRCWMESWAMGSILLTLVGQITSPNAHLEVLLSRPVKVHTMGNGQHVNQRKPGRPAP